MKIKILFLCIAMISGCAREQIKDTEMSRNVLSIKDLSSGINTEFDPGDIKETEATVLENVSVDRIGKIVPFNTFREFPLSNLDGLATHYNEGMLGFRADYNIDGSPFPAGLNYIISHIAGTPQKIRIAQYDAVFNSSYKEFDVENGTYRFIYHDNVVVAYDYSEDGIENKRKYIFRGANAWEKEGFDAGNISIIGNILTHNNIPTSSSNGIEYIGDLVGGNVAEKSFKFLENIYGASTNWNGVPMEIQGTSWNQLRSWLQTNSIPHVNDSQDGNGWKFDVERQSTPICVSSYIGAVQAAISGEEHFSSAFNITMINGASLNSLLVDGFDSSGENWDAQLVALGSDSKPIVGALRFKTSRILRDGTESALSEEDASINIPATRPLHLATFNLLKSYITFDFFQNSRGIKLYYKVDGNISWEYLLTVQEKIDAPGEYEGFLNDGTPLVIDEITGTYSTEAYNVLSVQNIHTVDLGLSYEIETGYNANESITAGFKKALIVNNRMFALNVYQNGVRHPDRILVSPTRNVFSLPDNNTLDVGMGDGEAFITAVHLNGLLYAFKSNTLYIINISSNDPSTFYIQGTHDGISVKSPNAVALSEFGVYFADQNGIYFHNGENLSNITYGRLQTEWTNFNTNTSNIFLGYSRRDKCLAIIAQVGGIVKTYIYSLKTDSFVTTNLLTNTPGAGNAKPFIHLNNELIIRWGTTKYFYKELDIKPPNTKIVTGAYSMGDSSVRKKVRRFYVSINPGVIENVVSNHITLRYKIDDGDFVSATFQKQDETNIMFDLPGSIMFRRIQIEVVLFNVSDQMIDSVNEISMVYRTKMPK